MIIDEKKSIELEKIRDLQESFDKSMRILESHIAESITNKEKLDSIKRDLKDANQKFIEAEKCLDDLKIDIGNSGSPFVPFSPAQININSAADDNSLMTVVYFNSSALYISSEYQLHQKLEVGHLVLPLEF